MYYVYFLKSLLHNEFYVGSTNDLKQRMKDHNLGKVFSTKRYMPWKLLYYEAYLFKKSARMREKRLKHHGNALRELKKRIGLGLPSTTFLKSSFKSGAGFTFIELILYVAIVTIILSALVPFAWSAIETGVKSAVQQEVNANARYISERIKYEIRNSTGINSVAATSISLVTSTLATNPTIIDRDLPTGNIRITQGTASPVNLNSANTVINSLTFTDYTSGDFKTKHVRFVMTIAASFAAARQEYQDSVVVESSAEVRSNSN